MLQATSRVRASCTRAAAAAVATSLEPQMSRLAAVAAEQAVQEPRLQQRAKTARAAAAAVRAVAQVVPADYLICPTVSTQDSVAVRYENPVFAGGYYTVNLIPFVHLDFESNIIYHVNSEYVNVYDAKEALEKALLTAFVAEKHTDTVKEDDVYNVIEATEYTGIDVLAINLKVDNNLVDYVNVPADKIAQLVRVNFAEG